MVAISVAFEYLNFVVTAFSEAISIFSCKRIKNTINPREHSFSTLLKRFYITQTEAELIHLINIH